MIIFDPNFPTPVLMQSLMGETTPVAHGGDPHEQLAPQDRNGAFDP
ncbi:MAG: hypothetical protein F6K50_21990 [Moorea sp. SIO3I7]|nr:hypothetical protein [Moorena sp. SIO3I8]NEN98088.1 hypothetical protein [Moorena sp. SIO3I7]NEO07740.1 hypothetical protein [Moorena sp. SIO3I8]